MEKIKMFIFGNREPAYTNKLPNQLSLGCRAVVGAYLIYLAKELIKGMANNTSSTYSTNMKVIIISAVVLFIVCGALFLYDSLRNFAIGRYPGGKLDLGENPDNALDAKDEDDYDDVVTEDEALEEYAHDEALKEEE